MMNNIALEDVLARNNRLPCIVGESEEERASDFVRTVAVYVEFFGVA
jgi:hypothetical protein